MMRSAKISVPVVVLALLGWPSPAEAWKVTTHQMTAVRGAQALPDGDVKTVLLANERYLRAGSMGPDIFYLPPGQPYNFFSDLAHYCKTDALALSLLRLSNSGGDQARAFAHGWFAHNVADSVAHPWVNGFTGQPYADPAPSQQGARNFALNLTHMGIEGWVDKQLAAQGLPSDVERGRMAQAGYDAFAPYQEDVIQGLMVDAYKETYGNEGCDGKKFSPLTKEIVGKAARNFRTTLGAVGFADFLLDIGDIELLDLELKKLALQQIEDVKKIKATWADYIGRTVQYNAKSWQATGALLNFNLDQGVDRGPAEVGEVWPDPDMLRVFEVPGKNYVGGRKPAYVDRCEEKKKNDCKAMTQNPGGDSPDDNASSATVAVGTLDAPGDLGSAHTRLAIKKGKAWPATLERLARQADALKDVSDPIAFLEAFAAQGRAFDGAGDRDPEFGRMVSSYEGDRSLLQGVLDVAVLDKGFASRAEGVLEQLLEPGLRKSLDAVTAKLAAPQPVLFIPSGGLYGLSQSDQFTAGLESYVSNGGTAVVFSQQRGSDFSVLPTPDGRPIRAWGWFEDNSCYYNGAYIDTFHPILASQSSALVTSAIDGYFDSIPENSIVLLRRVKNGMPAMFMYPYGQGWVIVTSSYDDWGGFNQSGAGARAIIRDAIAWAKKPADLPLNAPGSTAGVTLHVKNITDLPASQVKLVLMSPSRDRAIGEQTVGVAVAAGETAEVPFSYAFPANAELGIYHLDYELLDGAGITIQPVAEEDTGRIVVAQPPTGSPYRAADLQLSTVLPGGETFLINQPAIFRYRLVNRAPTSRHLRLRWDISHGPATLAAELDLAANSVLEGDLPITVTSEQFGRLNLWLFEDGGGPPSPSTGWGQAYDPGNFRVLDMKGFHAVSARAGIAVTPDKPAYRPGDTAQLAITVTNAIPQAWDGRVVLRWVSYLPDLAEAPVHLEANGSATVTVALPIPSGPLAQYYRQYYRAVLWGDRLAGGWYEDLVVTVPVVEALAPPAIAAWSRTSPNVVGWGLRNGGQVPLEGTLTARLE